MIRWVLVPVALVGGLLLVRRPRGRWDKNVGIFLLAFALTTISNVVIPW